MTVTMTFKDTQLHMHTRGWPTPATHPAAYVVHIRTSTDNGIDESSQCLETSNCQSLQATQNPFQAVM